MGIREKEMKWEWDNCLKRVQSIAKFTLGFDYDRIIIELIMKWVHIN